MVSKKEVNLDLFMVIGYVILTATFTLIPPMNETPIRTILGMPLILFIPGYILVATLFPHREEMTGVERIALSFGLSIVVVPLIGLGLNYTSWGLKLVPVMISLSLFILIMSVLAVIRRSLLPENEKYYVPFSLIATDLKNKFYADSSQRSDKILGVLLAILIIMSMLGLANIIVAPDQSEKFTEFYIKGKDGQLGGYPASINPGDDIVIIVGIINHEYENIDYTLDIQMENQSIDLPSDLSNVIIAHGQKWEQTIIFEPTFSGNESELKFLLYKNDNFTEPYRNLHLWIKTSEAENDN